MHETRQPGKPVESLEKGGGESLRRSSDRVGRAGFRRCFLVRRSVSLHGRGKYPGKCRGNEGEDKEYDEGDICVRWRSCRMTEHKKGYVCENDLDGASDQRWSVRTRIADFEAVWLGR